METAPKRLLLLTVAYGQGHNAAAAAIAEEFEARGWQTRTLDPCAQSSPTVFRATQMFYNFCVRRMPWLWRVTYAQTDTADWAEGVRLPILRGCTRRLAEEVRAYAPHAIICTYPLYAYMLDDAGITIPCTMVVTDAIEISRPWIKSRARLVCLPDAESHRMMEERFGFFESACTTGFPVRRAFTPPQQRSMPSPQNLGIVYGAYDSTRRVTDDLRRLLSAYPGCRITLIAGGRAERFRRLLSAEVQSGRLTILPATREMHVLFRNNHLYIGKAGAATVFEAYACHLPVIINYDLPGQEQGNLQKLLQDGGGAYACGARDLLHTIDTLLADGAARWQSMSAAMAANNTRGAAAAIYRAVIRHFFS